MSISLVAFGLIGLTFLLSLRVGLLAAGGLLLPFGMTAALVAGGASFNAFDLYFLSVGALYFARYASVKLPRTFILPIAFVALCLISAIFLPRLFSGLWVFPVNGAREGTRVSSQFLSTITPLHPTSANISQSAYVIFGMFYVMLFASVARRAPEKIHRLFVVAALSNITVSFVAMTLGSGALEPFRTADYHTLESATVFGIQRMVGAFPEASRYADFTAPLGVYFIGHFVASGQRASLYIGFVTTALALLALSSTGFVAVGAAAFFALWVSMRQKSRARRMMWMIAPIVVAIFAITLAMPGVVGDLVSRLIFEKGSSVSGLERGAWTAQGWRVAIETYFLGAGAGSVRSNGLMFVLLSNVGFVGTVIFGAILWRAFKRPSDTPIMVGLMVALVAITASRMVSQTTITPGIMFAILIGARTQLGQLQSLKTNDQPQRKIMSKIDLRHDQTNV